MSRTENSFLEHLAGMRGLAIILVVLFHLDGQVWEHAYLGVDVFLVITGYLLLRGRLRRSGTESLRDAGVYIYRRLQRIVTPMLPVIILTVGVSFILFRAMDEEMVCRLGYNACIGKANLYLARVFENYFAPDGGFNPLLHLWYLSTTLQVYLIYVVANLGLQRLPRRWCIGVLALLGIASLVWHSSFAVHEWLRRCGLPVWEQLKDVSYYATLPRLWEVLAGGMVCLLPSCRSRVWATALSGAGLGVVLLCSFSGASYAGTLAVVAGTVLVLRYLPESFIEKALSNAPLRWLGGISFSLYLVHMPVIVFCRTWWFGQMSCGVIALALGLALSVGWGYYHLVEKRRISWWGLVLLWAGAFGVCQAGRVTHGFERYMPVAPIVHAPYKDWQLCTDRELAANWDPTLNFTPQVFAIMQEQRPPQMEVPLLAMGDATKRANILFLGDSHALHAYAGMDAVFRREGWSGVFLSSIIVPLHGWHIIFGGDDPSSYYYNGAKEKALMSWLARQPQITHVVIAQRWLVRYGSSKKDTVKMAQDLRDYISQIKQLGKQVVLIGPSPEYGVQTSLFERVLHLRGLRPEDVSACLPRLQFCLTNEPVYKVLRQMEAEGLAVLVDVQGGMQAGEDFPAHREGELMMLDDNHLTPTGSLWFAERLVPQLRAVFGGQGK